MEPTTRTDSSEGTDLTSYFEVAAALLNPDLVPDVNAAEDFVGRNRDITLFLALGGREHSRRRASVSRVLATPAVRRLEPWMLNKARSMLAQYSGAEGSIEIATTFARRFCATSVARMLNISDQETERVIPLARQVVDSTRSHQRRVLAGYQVFQVASRALDVAARGAGRCGGMIGDLLRSGAEPVDILGVTMPLLVGGIELTARAVMASLAEAVTDGVLTADISDAALDRTIAASGIIPGAPRVALRRTHVGERVVEEQERLAVRLDAVSVDEAARPLPFGLGAHFCVGAAWTRSAARVSVLALRDLYPLAQLESMRHAVGAPGGPIELSMRFAP